MTAHRFGFHIPIAGGLQNVPERARRPRCDTIQTFTRNPRAWRSPSPTAEAIEAFRSGIARLRIDPMVIHTIYPINLASADKELREGSIELVAEDIRRADLLGAAYVNTHVGHAVDQSRSGAMRNVVRSLKRLLRLTRGCRARLLLENAAQKGEFHGSRFEELAALIDAVGQRDRMGVCLDSAHAYASGYPVHTEAGLDDTVAEIDRCVGLDLLFLVHLNDSKREFGSHADRHEHLGLGHIGRAGLGRIINHGKLRDLPFIMETPVDERRGDKGNLMVARRLARS